MSDLKRLTSCGAQVLLWFEDGLWVGSVPAWGMYMSHGDTPEEVMKNLEEGIEEYREVAKEAGVVLADPAPVKDNGRIALRVDGKLHTWLKWEADRQDVSLNTLLVSVLNRYMGGQQAESRVLEALAKPKGEGEKKKQTPKARRRAKAKAAAAGK